jgi:hypothetical protein
VYVTHAARAHGVWFGRCGFAEAVWGCDSVCVIVGVFGDCVAVSGNSSHNPHFMSTVLAGCRHGSRLHR